jgi:hypothetical protein
MYCTKGDENGSFERNDCYNWDYGNSYPQFHYNYYNNEPLYTQSKDPKFYPFLKELDDSKNTNYYNTESNYNQFYKKFNDTIKDKF